MLNLVPLARPRREVAHAEAQSGLVRKVLQFELPQACAVAIASPGVRSDEQVIGLRVRLLAHHLPPLPDRSYGELGGVVVATDADPRLAACHVVDAVRDGLADRGLGDGAPERLLGCRTRLPLPAAALGVADELLLLRVDRDHRLLPGPG